MAEASPLTRAGLWWDHSLYLEMLQLPLCAKLKGYQIAWLGLSYCFKLFSQFLERGQAL